MGFKAAEYVEPLDYDFRPHLDYHGTMAEPSDRDISVFLKKWYRLVGEMRKVTAVAVHTATAEVAAEEAEEAEPAVVLTTEQAIEGMLAIDWQAVENETDSSPQTTAARHTLTQMCRIVEDLAHGSIRAEKLEQVPMRVRGVFFGWLIEELTVQGKGKTGLPIS